MKAPLAIAAIAAASLLGGAARADDADPWFGPDKAKHFVASSSIAGGGYAASAIFTDDVVLRVVFGAGLGIAAGVGKEVLDAAGSGDPSARDLTWDFVGVGVGVGIALTIDLARRRTTRPIAY